MLTCYNAHMTPLFNHLDALELLSYSKETGLFSWSKQRRGVKVGIPLGCSNGFGYLRITVMGQSVYAHRLAWFYVHGKWPKDQIDHINGIKSDNRIANLRDVVSIENAQNKHGAQKNSKSLTMGVSWHKRSKKWQVHVCVYRERKYLGLFNDIKEAEAVYLKAKGKL